MYDTFLLALACTPYVQTSKGLPCLNQSNHEDAYNKNIQLCDIFSIEYHLFIYHTIYIEYIVIHSLLHTYFTSVPSLCMRDLHLLVIYMLDVYTC